MISGTIRLLSIPKECTSGSVDQNELSEDDIVADFRIRKDARPNHPGLSAEEYERIVGLVIKHLFNWDMDKQRAMGWDFLQKY